MDYLFNFSVSSITGNRMGPMGPGHHGIMEHPPILEEEKKPKPKKRKKKKTETPVKKNDTSKVVYLKFES